ncbi:NUDIX domain-containing protein [Planomicrobium sp. Y74]|uniref:NUDIX hydrolase n=1 Tax=Planomicrobium sp. Y74 TaxID=2478977 RepID=UPI001314F4DD|nr:NUDIX domain-containing protein [Planomicrobium sp. Y74]
MELWDLVDGNRNKLGRTHQRGIELRSGEYHVVVEIVTINADGRMLLTQRDPVKTYPLLWEITGGSITAGESSIEGAVRELKEETGLRAVPEQLTKIGEMKYGHYFRDSYLWKSAEMIQPSEMNLQPGEVCDAKLVTFDELRRMDEQGLTVPSVIERCQLYLEDLQKMMIG